MRIHLPGRSVPNGILALAAAAATAAIAALLAVAETPPSEGEAGGPPSPCVDGGPNPCTDQCICRNIKLTVPPCIDRDPKSGEVRLWMSNECGPGCAGKYLTLSAAPAGLVELSWDGVRFGDSCSNISRWVDCVSCTNVTFYVRATGCATPDGATVTFTASTGDSTCTTSATSRVECSCIDCGNAPGDGVVRTTDRAGVYGMISLGATRGGHGAGSLYFATDGMPGDLGDRATLHVSHAPGAVEVLYAGEGCDREIAQVLAPQVLASIQATNRYMYAVLLYDAAVATNKVGGRYVPTGDPFAKWTIEKLDGGAGSEDLKVRLYRYRNGETNPWRTYLANGAEGFVELRSGKDEGAILRNERVLSFPVVAGERIVQREILEPAGAPVASSVVETYRQVPALGSLPEREVLVKRRVDVDKVTAQEETRDLYLDPSTPGSYGKVRKIVHPDGSWNRYEYDGDGRVTKQVSSLLDVPDTAADADARVTLYGYTVTNDPGTAFCCRPRTVEERILGMTVGKSYHAYVPDGRGNLLREVSEQAASPSAVFGAPGNMRTTTEYYLAKEVDGVPERPKRIERPDGGVETYVYKRGEFTPNYTNPAAYAFKTNNMGTDLEVTVTRGTTESESGFPYLSTVERTVEHAYGERRWRGTHVPTGSAAPELVSAEVFQLDDRDKAIGVYGSDGTYRTLGCNCACDVTTLESEDGVRTDIEKDALKRKVREVKVGHTNTVYTIPSVTNTFVYDAAGRLLQQTTSSGGLNLTTSSKYNWAGRTTQSVDQAGIVTLYRYADGGRATTVQRGGLTNVTVRYLDGRTKYAAANGVVKQYHRYGAEPDGTQWTEVRTGADGTNSASWSRTVTDFLGRTIRQERPGFGGSTLTTSNSYDSLSHLRSSASICGTTLLSRTLYEYDQLGRQVVTCLDVEGYGTIDTNGADRITESRQYFQKTADDWYGVQVSKVYPKTGSAACVTTSVQRTRLTGLGSTNTDYSANARLVSESVAEDIYGKQTVSRRYIDRGTQTVWQVVAHPDSTNAAATVTVNGLVMASTGKTGLETAYDYDALGRQTGVVDPRTGANTTHYNSKGQVDWVEDPATNRTTYAYDAGTGQRTAVTNALGQATYYHYDAEGRLLGTWGNVYPVFYGYDDVGRMTSMWTLRDSALTLDDYSDFTANESSFDETQWQYDQATGLLTNKQYASDSSYVSYSYTPDGKLETRHWARGIATTYRYAACCGAMTNLDYGDSTPDVTFAYDRMGRQAAIADGQGVRTFQYDPATLALTNEVLVAAGVTTRLARAQDAYGRPAGVALDDSYAVEYGYDTLGRFSQVAWSLPGNAATATYAYAEDSDLVAGYDVPVGANAFSPRKAFDPHRNLITAVSNLWNSTSVSGYAYDNDSLARRTRRVDNGSRTNDFGYNLRSELASALMGTNRYGYVYDPIGNRTSATNPTETLTYLSNELNQYTNIAAPSVTNKPTYDLDGNLLTNGVWAYSWNGENRLISVSSNGSPVATYAYDYMGRRYRKVAGGVTNVFVYDGWAMIREESPAATNEYVYGMDLSGSLQGAGTIGGLLVASLGGSQSPATVFYAYDANGNVTELVNTDGSTAAKYGYDPFGNTVLADDADSSGVVSENPFRFSTKYFDAGPDLYYYGYRYYAPHLGRWLSRDPMGEQGSLPLMLFVFNDALLWFDPDGMIPSSFVKAAKADASGAEDSKIPPEMKECFKYSGGDYGKEFAECVVECLKPKITPPKTSTTPSASSGGGVGKELAKCLAKCVTLGAPVKFACCMKYVGVFPVIPPPPKTQEECLLKECECSVQLVLDPPPWWDVIGGGWIKCQREFRCCMSEAK